MCKQTETGKFTDPRDGKTYKTVKIGEQVWFAENLNWEGAGVCYNEDPDNGVKYGRLYTWNEALAATPPGWHLPDYREWEFLVLLAGGGDAAGENLKATYGWHTNGTDALGFSALPGGGRNSRGGFHYADENGTWWSATEDGHRDAYNLMILGDSSKAYYSSSEPKSVSLSVRLVRY